MHREPPDANEITGLVHSGRVRLTDAENPSNSLESRFDLAYNASPVCQSTRPGRWTLPVALRQLRLTATGVVFGMSPTVLRVGAYRLFFFSREEPRMHVHVAHPDGEAKFWLSPGIDIAATTGLSARQVAEAQDIVERNIEEIRHAWTRHFGC